MKLCCYLRLRHPPTVTLPATRFPNRTLIRAPEMAVREAVEEGVGDILQAQARLNEVYAAYAEEGADFDKLAKEQERLEAILAAGDAHTLENQQIGRAHV